ncbi:MAG: hypothetical protein EA369_09625 [Bradymonadales bacterium]|nr:MAG: hypothetical protein EA369_09625 [Bradymonadales bacterium]
MVGLSSLMLSGSPPGWGLGRPLRVKKVRGAVGLLTGGALGASPLLWSSRLKPASLQALHKIMNAIAIDSLLSEKSLGVSRGLKNRPLGTRIAAFFPGCLFASLQESMSAHET